MIRKPSRASSLRRKLWEWNAGWMGFGLSLAIAFLISNGTKNLVGKPRPDLLARCNPDLSRTLNSTVGGVGNQVDEGINLVLWTISFAITIPFLKYQNLGSKTFSINADEPLPPRSQAAAPPIYILVFPLIPTCAAIYISTTRYSDFYHHGFNIIIGAILGIASAWLGFRWYHLPIRRGRGWAWAPRSPDQAFSKGIGLLVYASEGVAEVRRKDLESGRLHARGIGEASTLEHPTSSEGSQGIELGDIGEVRGYGHGRASESSRRPLR